MTHAPMVAWRAVGRGALLLGAALLAASCALSAPKSTHFTHYLPIPTGQARVYVYRPETSIKTPREGVLMELDVRPLAVLERDQYVSVVLPAGQHKLGSRVSAGVTFSPHLPARVVELHADRATYCRVLPIPEGVVFDWDVRCSEDTESHAALRECSETSLDRTVDWQP